MSALVGCAWVVLEGFRRGCGVKYKAVFGLLGGDKYTVLPVLWVARGVDLVDAELRFG
jgi:hypothetical protein